MFVTPSGSPVRLEMQGTFQSFIFLSYWFDLINPGYDFLFGSHPDVYILDYLSFKPSVASSEFNVPGLCVGSAKQMSFRSQERSKALLGLIKHMTTPVVSNDEFDQYSAVVRFLSLVSYFFLFYSVTFLTSLAQENVLYSRTCCEKDQLFEEQKISC